MHAIEQGRTLLFQRFGRRNVGGDHHFFDQAVGRQALRYPDILDHPLLIENNLALGQVELERAAPVAGGGHGVVGGKERAQDGLEQRAGLVIGLAVNGGLGLLIAELGRRAHQYAVEAVAALASIGTKHHAHGERRARLALLERAHLIGNALGEHGHHAVGEIDRIATQIGFAIERRARTHIGGHIGNGDIDQEPVRIGRIGIVLGQHRVVMVLGVGRIDGDQGQVAPVLAALERGLGRFGGFAQHGLGEAVGNFEIVNGDHRDRAFGFRIADHGGDAGARNHQAARELDVDLDEVPITGIAQITERNAHFLLLAIDRDEAGAIIVHAHDADMGAARLVEDLHRLGGIDRHFVFAGIDPGEDPVTGGGGNARIAAAKHGDAGAFALFVVPLRREGVQIVRIGIARNVEHGDGGQGGGAAQRLAGARDDAVAFEFLEHGLEWPAHIAPNAKNLGQVALALDIILPRQRFEQLFAGGQFIGGRFALALGAGSIFWFLGRSSHQVIF